MPLRESVVTKQSKSSRLQMNVKLKKAKENAEKIRLASPQLKAGEALLSPKPIPSLKGLKAN